VYVVDGTRTPKNFATKGAAIDAIVAFNKAVSDEDRSLSSALDRYAEYLDDKGNAAKSNATTLARLRAFFAPFKHEPIDTITEQKAAKIYQSYRKRKTRTGRPPTAATHRGVLKQARTFAAWCRDKGWCRGNPFAAVELMGKPTKGKPSLRINEARKLYQACITDGSDGAFAVATALLMGTRATETVTITARDVDDGGNVLWVEGEGTKHADGPRALALPDTAVRDWIARRAAYAKGGRLWPGKDRTWLYREARRLSKAAGIPPVGAQQLRVTHSTLTKEHGITAAVVADQLGHTEGVNRDHYSRPGVEEAANARRVFGVINGGA
jgi:integrase